MGSSLGILAGGGTLPARLIEVCRATGREVFVVAFEGQTDPASVAGVAHIWTHLGLAEQPFEALHEAGVEDLVMVGPISRPSLSELRLDRRSTRFFAKIGAKSLGDDGFLRAVIEALEEEGFRILGVDEILRDLVARIGPYGVHEPDAQAREDIDRGFAVGRALGAVDVGQAVVVQQGLVLGVEAIEGTDRLLSRCAELRRDGLGGVLVKVQKPGQERRVDLPSIGVQTVRSAAEAGLRGIAVEAGGALVIEPEAVGEAADAAGLFVVGIA